MECPFKTCIWFFIQEISSFKRKLKRPPLTHLADSSTEVRDAETFRSYHFQPSVNQQELLIASAHFWFYAGPESNSSAPLYILTPGGRHPDRLAAEAPSVTGPDGWATYDLDQHHRLAVVYSGPLTLQVRAVKSTIKVGSSIVKNNLMEFKRCSNMQRHITPYHAHAHKLY